MIAPKNLKLNRFSVCRIPKPSELFTRMQNNVNVPKQGYSGDDHVDVFESRKTDIDFTLLDPDTDSTN